MKLPASPERNERRWAAYVGLLFCLVLLARLVLLRFYNANFGGLEMNVIYGIQRIVGGEPLYQNPSLPGYGIIQYTPLFYYLAAGLARLLQLHMRDVYALYVCARSLNLFFNLLAVWLTAGIIRQSGFSPLRAWTFAMPLLLILTFEYFTRVDSLQLLCFVATMYLSLRFLRSGHFVWMLSAAFAAGACIMSKQSGVLAVGIVSFYFLFVQRRYGPGLLFPVLSLLFTALIGWLCMGQNVSGAYQNAVLGLKNGIGWDWLYTIFISQFYYDFILFYFLGGVIVWAAFKSIRDPVFSFLATGVALSFLFAVITGLKVGSSNNYFTEFLFFCLCALPGLLRSGLAGRILLTFGNRSLSIRQFAWIAFFILVSSKTMGLVSGIWVEGWIKNKKELYQRQELLLEYFQKNKLLHPGVYVYSGTRDFFDNLFIGYSLLPTKDVTTQVYRADSSLFDYSALKKGMNHGLIRYVVVPAEYGSIQNKDEEVPFMHFDARQFRLLAQVAGYSIYKYSGA
ncbi:MAG: hypothetical protein JST06_09740 [Bacteroidetes bacterium]|nr:hypothetical protein [Bacteroidota bacterium]MBS1630252.1 hypothetical protein [Bacteroidota bacterium]